jgi:hypothetical protein
VKYIALLLAERVVELLDQCGASEVEKLAALHAALAVVPTTQGTVYAKGVASAQAKEQSSLSGQS